MKRIYFILIIFLCLSACNEDDDQNLTSDEANSLDNLQIRWETNQNVEEYDTIDVHVHLEQFAAVLLLDDIYTFNWNINDDIAYTSRNILHSFQSNGIKEITLTVKIEDKQRIFTFYIHVYGCLINNVEYESYGYFIDESDNLSRTVFTREDNDMIGYEFNNYELVSRKILDQDAISFLEVVDFSKDINGYLNMWTWIDFYKYDKHADKLFEKSIFAGEVGNIYISTENEYFLIGTSGYRTGFYQFDQNGGNYSRDTLHESNENLKSSDGLMLNDSTYILLINNTDNNETSLIQKHLNSDDENALILFSDNYHRILKTNEGYITYEIGGEAIAYLDQNLNLVWNMEIFKQIGFERMRLREYQNSFLIINRNQLISISKSGEINFINDYYDTSRFTFKSISESSNNALILADIHNIDKNNATIMFLIDEDGNMIE